MAVVAGRSTRSLDSIEPAMKCPHCHEVFPLTWSRYWRAPFGKHTCPRCAKKSKLHSSLVYWLLYWPLLLIAPAVSVFGIGVVYALMAGPGQSDARIAAYFDGWMWVPAMLLPFVLFPPIDRFIDERFRKLRPLEKGNAV